MKTSTWIGTTLLVVVLTAAGPAGAGGIQLNEIRIDQPGTDNDEYFELSGEDLSLPPGQSFPIYALAALLPLLPAKQRLTHANDWMTTDTDVACPDPHCGAIFRITRTGKRTFRHGEVTLTPLTPPTLSA